MKAIVIDASVAASWWLQDEVNPTADWVLDEMQAGTLISAPSLWLLEVTNMLFNAERRKRIDRAQRESALRLVEVFPVTLLNPPALSDLKMLSLYAEKHQLTAYDAEYLRVAKYHKAMLATLDSNLIAAAKKEKVLLA